MRVQLLYFDGCPNWQRAAAALGQLAAETPGLEIERIVVDTPEKAEHVGFRGSPSIRVDGRDLFANAGDPVGLSCRIYWTPDGPAGSPTLEQLRAAVEAAADASPASEPGVRNTDDN